MVGLSGAALDAAALAATLRGHLADLAVVPEVVSGPSEGPWEQLVWARERAATGAIAVAWIERGTDGCELRLLLSAPERLYARHLATPGDPLETREILGVVLRGLVASLAAHEAPPEMVALTVPAPPDPPPSPPPPAAPDPGPSASPRPAARLVLGLAYAGSSYAAALPWASGAALELGALTPRGLVVAFDAAGLAHAAWTPTLGQQRLGDAALRLARVALALRLGVRLHLGARRRFFFEPALALRGELAVWRPAAGSRALSGVGVRAALSPTLGVGVALPRGLALVLRLGLDLWLRNLDLVARTGAGATTLARPPLPGASLAAGLVWTR